MRDLTPTSPAGYAAFEAGVRPPTERIDEGAAVCAVELPPGGIVTSTLCYLFRGAGSSGHLVDPGWNSDAGFAAIEESMAMLGVTTIDSVVTTHLHADHLGMAERIRDAYGAALVMSSTEWRTYLEVPDENERNVRYDEWGVPADRRPHLPQLTAVPDQSPRTEPDVLVSEGDVLDLGRNVTVLSTPGHTEGSISLVDTKHELILTGDHVLPHIHPGLGLDYAAAGDPVGDYLEALERVASFDGYDVLPGHGYRFRRLSERAAQIARHHLRRARQVADAVMTSENDPTVWELASHLSWARGWDGLEGYFLNSALQQTAMHRRFVTSPRGERWLASEDVPWLTQHAAT